MKSDLASIAGFADKICNVIPTTGERQSAEANGNVKAELNGLLKKLGDLGISGTGGYSAEEYAGVLQKDLANAIKNNSDCKLTVVRMLVDRVLPQAEAATKKQEQEQEHTEALRRRLSAVFPKLPVYIKCRTVSNTCEKLAYFFFDELNKAGWPVAAPATTQLHDLALTGERAIAIISSSLSADQIVLALRAPDAGAFPAMLNTQGPSDHILINIGDLP
ncbi:MAG: hypothetical protein ABSC06_17355 [Rhodopila sp.]|jgi:hypothetical protein